MPSFWISRGHDAPIESLAWSTDGRRLLSRAAGKSKVWELSSGLALAEASTAPEALRLDKAFGPFLSRRDLVVVGHAARGLDWVAATITTLSELAAPPAQPPHPPGAPERSEPRQQTRFVLESGQLVRRPVESDGLDDEEQPILHGPALLVAPTDTARSLKLARQPTPAGDLLAIVYNGGTGRELVRVPTPQTLARLEFGGITGAAYSADGTQLALGLGDGGLVVWDLMHARFVNVWRSSAADGTALMSAFGEKLVITSERETVVWDLLQGTRRVLRRAQPPEADAAARPSSDIFDFPGARSLTTAALGEGGAILAGGFWDSSLKIYDDDSGTWRKLTPINDRSGFRAAVSPDNRYYAYSTVQYRDFNDDIDSVWIRPIDHSAIEQKVGTFPITRTLRFLPQARGLVVADDNGDANIYTPDGRTHLRTLPCCATAATVYDIVSDASGRVLLGNYDSGEHIWVYRDESPAKSPAWSKWTPKELSPPAGMRIGEIALAADASRAAFVARTDVIIWDVARNAEAMRFSDPAGVRTLAFTPDGGFVVTLAGDEVHYWDIRGREPVQVLRLIPRTDGGGAVVAPDGRFDITDLEAASGLGWRLPGPDGRVVPLETFMRDFYEPQLVARTLACRSAPSPTAACAAQFPALNLASVASRRVPDIRITAIRAAAQPDEAIVELATQPESGAVGPAPIYDVALFRDGVLVRTWPGLASPDGSSFTTTVRLPRGRGSVEFSAYGFNADRVKSRTWTQTYVLPSPLPVLRKPRAYIVAVGAAEYADGGVLEFAVADVEQSLQSLSGLQGYDPIRIPLISREPTYDATKSKIRAALGVLAGDEDARAPLAMVPEAAKLERAGPEDLVVIYFSGHGQTDFEGRFYLVPADAGSGQAGDADARQRLISTDDLAQWVSAIDAGQIIMIIDACHAAGAVESPNFRPGPMGDRGFGQLAYNKGMRILAASQADSPALQIGILKQSLLSDVLNRRAFGDGRDPPADQSGDHRLSLAEWLRFGERQTPLVQAAVVAGLDREARSAPGADHILTPQQPKLFDYVRQAPVVYLTPPASAITSAPKRISPALDSRRLRLRLGRPGCEGRLSAASVLDGDFTGAIHVGPKEAGWGSPGGFDYANDQWPRETPMRQWFSQASRREGGGLVFENLRTDDPFPYQSLESWRGAEIVLEVERAGTMKWPSIPADQAPDTDRRADFEFFLLPCRADLVVELDGRSMVRASGQFALTQPRLEDGIWSGDLEIRAVGAFDGRR